MLDEVTEAGIKILIISRNFVNSRPRYPLSYAKMETSSDPERQRRGSSMALVRSLQRAYSLFSCHLSQNICRAVCLASEIRQSILSASTASAPHSIRSKHQKNLTPMLVNTVSRFSMCCLSESKCTSLSVDDQKGRFSAQKRESCAANSRFTITILSFYLERRRRQH